MVQKILAGNDKNYSNKVEEKLQINIMRYWYKYF